MCPIRNHIHRIFFCLANALLDGCSSESLVFRQNLFCLSFAFLLLSKAKEKQMTYAYGRFGFPMRIKGDCLRCLRLGICCGAEVQVEAASIAAVAVGISRDHPRVGDERGIAFLLLGCGGVERVRM